MGKKARKEAQAAMLRNKYTPAAAKKVVAASAKADEDVALVKTAEVRSLTCTLVCCPRLTHARAPQPGRGIQPKTRGLPRSGRNWKRIHDARFSSQVKVKGLRSTFAKRMEQRKKDQAFKQVQQALRDKQRAEREERRRRAEQRRKQKEENERKSSVVQVIKDTKKIKRMSKKQRRTLMKMDPAKLGV